MLQTNFKNADCIWAKHNISIFRIFPEQTELQPMKLGQSCRTINININYDKITFGQNHKD